MYFGFNPFTVPPPEGEPVDPRDTEATPEIKPEPPINSVVIGGQWEAFGESVGPCYICGYAANEMRHRYWPVSEGRKRAAYSMVVHSRCWASFCRER